MEVQGKREDESSETGSECNEKKRTENRATVSVSVSGWLVGWGLTAVLTQNRSYRACRFVGIFYSKL